MEQRIMTGLDKTISRLGMGNMRLPTNSEGAIDYPVAEKIIDCLMAGGVTYYDTAWFYHGGNSEVFLGKALTARYPREGYSIATKLPVGEAKDAGDVERIFNIQRERLGANKIDFYLLHGVNYEGWKKASEIGAYDFIQKKKAEGLIGHIGFSFHGNKEDLPMILDEGDWDFVQAQLNYYYWYDGGAEKFLYEEIYKRGVALVVMGPVRGGGLAGIHKDAAACFEGMGTPAEAALRWVADLPGADVVLSGMSSLQQAEENIRTFTERKPLNDVERGRVMRAAEILRNLKLIPCTACDYCKGCPAEIPISRLLTGYNDAIRFGGSWALIHYYFNAGKEKERASACTACGACEKKCPQGIKIIGELKKTYEKALEIKGRG